LIKESKANQSIIKYNNENKEYNKDMKNISKETGFFQYKNEAKFEYNLYLEYINY